MLSPSPEPSTGPEPTGTKAREARKARKAGGPRPELTPEAKRRRARITILAITGALAAVCAVVLSLPSVTIRTFGGPSQTEIDLGAQRARGDDLKRQLDEANAKLSRPRPVEVDKSSQARADDLKRQVDELNKLIDAEAATPGVDPGQIVEQRARAEDLKDQLSQAELKLATSRPVVVDDGQKARAEDLSAQVQELSGRLSAPRPPAPPAPVVATMNRDQIIAARKQFGLYTAQSPFNFAEVDAVEGAVGRRPNIVGYFQGWTDQFRGDAIVETWRRGQIPLLTWESHAQTHSTEVNESTFSLPTIINGAHDEYIRSYARGIAQTGLPIILRFNHEMNAGWYPWSEVNGTKPVNGNSRGDFVKAWRHVHDIFTQEGANQHTIWLWAPNRVDRIPKQPPVAEFYPGDEYVDWVGMSGYHRYAYDEPTFDNIYAKTLVQLRALTKKPIFLAEIGSTEVGGNKVPWIDSFFQGLADNPDILGFAWFNLSVTSTVDGEVQTNDWRINSSGSATEAFRNGAAASGFGLVPPAPAPPG